MIEINLLNKTGKILNSHNENFDFVDNSFVSEESTDFESNYKVTPIKVKRQKRIALFFISFITIALISCSIYYQFFYQNKSFISSSSFTNMVHYILEDDNLTLNQMNINSYGVNLVLDIRNNSFNEIKKDLKKHFDMLDLRRKVIFSKTNESIFIDYPYFIDFVADMTGYNIEQQSALSDSKGVGLEGLKGMLSDFLLNKGSLQGFDVNLSSDDLYDVYFLDN